MSGTGTHFARVRGSSAPATISALGARRARNHNDHGRSRAPIRTRRRTMAIDSRRTPSPGEVLLYADNAWTLENPVGRDVERAPVWVVARADSPDE